MRLDTSCFFIFHIDIGEESRFRSAGAVVFFA